MIADNKTRIAISITKEQQKALEALASALGITKSAVIQVALTEYLDAHKRA